MNGVAVKRGRGESGMTSLERELVLRRWRERYRISMLK